MSEQEPSLRLVLCTAPSIDVAEALADALLQEHLVACVTLLPGARSVYRWQGQIQRDEEVLLLIKTTAHAYPALQARVQALHPYQIPELLALTPSDALPAYRNWLIDMVQA